MSRWLWPGRGATTRQPVTVRFEGVEPHTDLARALYNQLGGQINQFYQRAAAHHNAGVTEFTKLRHTTPDMVIEYTNNAGQETLHIHVAAGVVARAIPKPKLRYDWAVVDVTTDVYRYVYADSSLGYSHLQLYAQVVSPSPTGSTKAHPEAEWGAAGYPQPTVPGPYTYSAEAAPKLQWASTTLQSQVGITGVAAAETDTQSLLVDLREYKPDARVVVDLYARMSHLADDAVPGAPVITGRYDAAARTTAGILWYRSITTEAEVLSYYPSISGTYTFAAVNNAADLLNITELQANTFSYVYGLDGATYETWVWSAGTHSWGPYAGGTFTPGTIPSALGGGGGYRSISQYGGMYYLLGDTPAMGVATSTSLTGRYDGDLMHQDYEDAVIMYLPIFSTPTIHVPVVPTGVATVAGATFQGKPDWAWSEDLTPVSSTPTYKWQIRSNWPNRFTPKPLGPAAAVPLPLSDTPAPSNHYGLNLLGRLTIDVHTGSMAFKPA